MEIRTVDPLNAAQCCLLCRHMILNLSREAYVCLKHNIDICPRTQFTGPNRHVCDDYEREVRQTGKPTQMTIF